MTQDATDDLILRPVLMRRLGVCSDTIRRWLRDKKLPPPDVAITVRKTGWKLSTLRAHGVNLP